MQKLGYLQIDTPPFPEKQPFCRFILTKMNHSFSPYISCNSKKVLQIQKATCTGKPWRAAGHKPRRKPGLPQPPSAGSASPPAFAPDSQLTLWKRSVRS